MPSGAVDALLVPVQLMFADVAMLPQVYTMFSIDSAAVVDMV
jgi:hypothetical protein